ncbi:anaerobic ribonucleoside-triphosphate reductase [Mailhella sp.]|uniref:anaerobic ribonucleoside-triphosphate reductase n=1 Tax=Mailhella sp. TaxID=1981029 RepID=UPI00406462A7
MEKIPAFCSVPFCEKDGQLFLGEGVLFERIRRITGYLVGDLSRFNDAKRSEEKDRLKHASMR